MKFYIYYDRYRHPRKAVSEKELAEAYDNSPDAFLRAVCSLLPDKESENARGHVGIMRFGSETELREYLESTGEEIIGFYECQADSRPYNF